MPWWVAQQDKLTRLLTKPNQKSELKTQFDHSDLPETGGWPRILALRYTIPTDVSTAIDSKLEFLSSDNIWLVASGWRPPKQSGAYSTLDSDFPFNNSSNVSTGRSVQKDRAPNAWQQAVAKLASDSSLSTNKVRRFELWREFSVNAVPYGPINSSLS